MLNIYNIYIYIYIYAKTVLVGQQRSISGSWIEQDGFIASWLHL